MPPNIDTSELLRQGKSSKPKPKVSGNGGKGSGGGSDSLTKELAERFAKSSKTNPSTLPKPAPTDKGSAPQQKAEKQSWFQKQKEKRQTKAKEKKAFNDKYKNAKVPAFRQQVALNEQVFKNEDDQDTLAKKKETDRKEDAPFVKSAKSAQKFREKALLSKVSGGQSFDDSKLTGAITQKITQHGHAGTTTTLDDSIESVGTGQSALTAIGGLTSAGGGMAKGLDTLKTDVAPSMAVSDLGAGIASDSGSLVSLVSGIMDILGLIFAKLKAGEDASSEQQEDLSLQLSQAVMNTAATGGTIAKNIMDLVAIGESLPKTSSLLTTAIPGLGIAISATQLVATSVDLGRQAALVHRTNSNMGSLQKMVKTTQDDKQMGDIAVLKGAIANFKSGAVGLLIKDVISAFSSLVSIVGSALSMLAPGTPAHGAGVALGGVSSGLSAAKTLAFQIVSWAQAGTVKKYRDKYKSGQMVSAGVEVTEMLIKKDPKHAAQTLLSYANGVGPDGKQVDPTLQDHAKKQLKALGVGDGELKKLTPNQLRDLMVSRVGYSQEPKTFVQTFKDIGKKVSDIFTKNPLHYSGKRKEIKNLAEVKNTLGYGGVNDRGFNWINKHGAFSKQDDIRKQQAQMKFLVAQSPLSEDEKDRLLQLLPGYKPQGSSGGSSTGAPTTGNQQDQKGAKDKNQELIGELTRAVLAKKEDTASGAKV
ncbi:MAG: hypothetical protein M0Z47_10625 [Actinomycetota bacterium]|nr:hypothetical protein [Actinomycetota bacterium]